jgi:hypothetical protein
MCGMICWTLYTLAGSLYTSLFVCLLICGAEVSEKGSEGCQPPDESFGRFQEPPVLAGPDVSDLTSWNGMRYQPSDESFGRFQEKSRLSWGGTDLSDLTSWNGD